MQTSENDLTNNNKGLSYTNLSSTLPLRNGSRGSSVAAATSSALCHGYEDYDEVADPCDDIVLPPTGQRCHNTMPTRLRIPSTRSPPSSPRLNTSLQLATPPDTPTSFDSSSSSLPSRYRKSRSFRTLHRVFGGMRRTQSQGDDDNVNEATNDTQRTSQNKSNKPYRLRSQNDLGMFWHVPCMFTAWFTLCILLSIVTSIVLPTAPLSLLCSLACHNCSIFSLKNSFEYFSLNFIVIFDYIL